MTKYGFIYQITSPSQKSYIGQTVEYSGKGYKKGIEGRWKEHLRSAKSKRPSCPYLAHAIKKYGSENFKITKLMKTTLDRLDLFEELYIKVHKTLAPHGYNLQTGGTFTTHSEITRKKRSDTMKKLLENPEKRKIWSRAKLGIRRKEKRKCKKKWNQKLPKYIFYREYKGGKYGRYVVEHPNGTKSFGRKTNGLDENLRLAKEYLSSIDGNEITAHVT